MKPHNPSPASYFIFCCCALTALWVTPSRAAIPDVAGKTGEIKIKLGEKSSLSAPADISKRMSIDLSKRPPHESDYDLSRENFTAYVPKEAGADGKYGLVVAVAPRNFGKPPESWAPILDKDHLIWICADNNTDGRQVVQRVGLVLDCVYNAQATWQIDMGRVFLFNCANEPPLGSMEMFYPDVFDGTLQCNAIDFYTKIADTKQQHGFTWKPRISKPADEILNQAKDRRYFFVDKLEDHYGDSNQTMEMVNSGFLKNGFKNVKTFPARTEVVMKYLQQPADWFEAGITYLDVKPQTPAVALTKMEGSAEAQAGDSAVQRNPLHNADPKSAAPAKASPPTATTPAKETAPPAAAAPPPPPVPVVEETPADKAQRALNAVKSYIAAQRYDIARTRLQKIVTDYPDTPAAKDAKKMLEEIKDK